MKVSSDNNNKIYTAVEYCSGSLEKQILFCNLEKATKMIKSRMFVLLFVILLCFPSFFHSEARNCPCHDLKVKHSTSRSTRKNVHGSKVKTPIHSNIKPTQVAEQHVLNVESFGAKADEKTDNFQAFKKAWDKACNSLGPNTILVPKGKTYFVKHINFTGPCKSGISMEIQGTIKAFPIMYDVPRRLWIKFEDVTNVDIFGGGTIHGNGDIWWKNSCKIKKNKPCQTQNAPTALTFQNCANLRVSNLKVVNPQQMHINIQDSRQVDVSRLTVTAPEESPNTDGIHITRSTSIVIRDSVIQTGDDCISIVNGSRNIEARNIVCGPGHGISIGSLGEDNSENHVSNIHVKGVKLTGTTNGVRIKTWQGGKGTARNIMFEDIYMKNVANPIVINQHYCDKGKNKQCEKQKDAVVIENIVYKNISGTSVSKVGVNFNCSESIPCRNLMLQNVNLRYAQASQENDDEAIFCSMKNVVEPLPRCPMHN